MRIGRREALDTFRYALNAAGRTVRVQASETGVVNRAVARARRSMLVDVVLTDILKYCNMRYAMEIPVCTPQGSWLWKPLSADSDAI